MKKISIFFFGFLLFLQFLFVGGAWGQFAVTTNSSSGLASSYASLSAAITALNAATISSPVVITCPTGTEAVPAAGYVITAQGTSVNTITIQGNGAANSIITGGSGVSTTTFFDAFFALRGADWVTIQGFAMTQSASTTTLEREIGVALLHASVTNGAQNNTIQNNTITLNKTNLNTWGIYSNNNHSATTAWGTTEVVTNNTTGPASGNKVYNNIITNVNMGIAFLGTTTAVNQDIGNDVGGTSAGTGNTITNWGGAGATNTPAGNSGTSYCIMMNHQVGDNVSYNTITSATISGTSVSLRGIFKDYTTTGATIVGTTNITNNTITITDNFTSGTLECIRTQGTVATTSTLNINNNTILNSSMGGASSSTSLVGIVNSEAVGTLSMSSNIVRGCTSTATTGGFTGVSNTGAVVTTITMNSNQIGNASGGAITFSAATSGAVLGVNCSGGASTCSVSIQNNDIRGIVYSALSTAAHTYITQSAAVASANVAGNTFTNLSINTSGAVTFISHSYTIPATGSMIINNNSIVTAFTRLAAGSITITTTNGSSVSGAINNYTNNNFSNIIVPDNASSTIIGFNNTDGGTASTKTITGNIFNNWHGGTSGTTGTSSAINCMNFTYWNGVSSLSNNTITNITGRGAITGITMGSTVNTATSIAVSGNTINNLASIGTGGQVLAISCSNTSTTININGNAINTLSTSGVSSAVGGILITGAATINVFSNTIYGMVASGTTSPLALGVSVQGGTTVNTYGNKIYNISATGAISTTSPAVIGLNITAGTTVNSFNNLIGDLKAASATSTDAIRGISITSSTASTSYNVYNNTVYLTGSGGANFGTSGIYHAANSTASTAKLDLQNNMIFNTCTPSGTGIVTAFRRSAAATLGNYATTSNKNLFYAGTPSATTTIMSDGTNNYQTLATFQTAVSTRDANSFTESAFTPSTYFVSATGSNANYLQPTAGLTTQAESGGNTIAMCSPDYNGVSRPGAGANAYDVGAWEFNGAVCIAPTSLAATASSPAQTTTTISGEFTAATTAPSAYLVVRTATNTQPTPVTGTTYSVGSNAIGFIEYVGASAGSWTSTGLTTGTTYYYWVFSYNNTACSGGPVYSASTTNFSASTTTCPATSLAGLSYSSNPASYCLNSVITQNTATLTVSTGGIIYSVSPVLPAGLALSSTTGTISGTPSVVTAAADYTVTANNGCTSTSVAVNIAIVALPTSFTATAATSILPFSFSANWPAGTSATSYTLDVATDNAFTSLVSGYSGLSVGNVLTYSVTGLSAGNTYYYRVRYTNGSCTSLNSNTIAVTTTVITSLATGNWNATTTWNSGTVPTCGDIISIATGHVVTVNSASNVSKNITIASGGTLIVASGDLTVGCTLNNTPLTNNGTLTVSGGTLNVNGYISSSSIFNQTGGNINVDPNSEGVLANSTTSAQYTLNLSGTVQWTGGILTLIDPPASTSTSHYSIYYSSSFSFESVGHTLVFGDGISSTAGGSSIGFLIYNYVGSGRLNFGNAIVNGSSVTASLSNRIVQQTIYSNQFHGDFTVNNNGEFLNSAILVGGNILVNSGGILTSTGTLTLARPSGSSSTINTSSQTISGTGTFRNLTSSPTANLSSLTLNNSNATGVTISSPISISGTLTMTAGKINTTSTNLLTLGTSTVAGTLAYTAGQIAGPFARTFQASRTATGTYTVATLYPVGDGTTYLPIHIDPTTSAGGAIVLQGQAFNANSGTAGTGVSNTLSNKRWEALALTGSSNLTNCFIQLNDASIASSNIIAQATSASGTYNSILPTSTYTAGTPNNLKTATAIAAANYAGYFTYAAPGPAITSFTPASACPNAATTITITGTNLGSATSVTLNGEACTIVTNTATQLVVTTDATPQAGNIVLTTAANSATSPTALTLFTLPTVTASSNASNNTICSGISITLNGAGANSFTWNNSVTNNTAFFPSSSTTYTVTGTDGNACTNTASIAVTVNNAVVISSQPTNQVVLPSDNAVFSVTAAGTGLTYQWQESTDIGVTWSNVSNGGIYSGATSATLTLTNVSIEDGYKYRCVVSGTAPCGSLTSNPAMLTISNTSISAHPQNQVICVTAGSATFSITTTGNIPDYQWQVSTDNGASWTDISGELFPTLTLTGLTQANNGELYQCSLNGGSVLSNSALLTVSPASVAGTVSADQGICANTAPANITLTGNTGTVQWQVSTDNSTFTNITNATSSTLTAALTGSLSATRFYRAIVTSGACAAATSGVVTATVTPTPNAGTLSGTQNVCINSTTTFSSNGNSGGAWTSSNLAVATVDASSGVVSGVSTGTATITYTITGTGGCSNVSATRTVTVNALPTITSATATPSTVCSGATITLTGVNSTSANYVSSRTAPTILSYTTPSTYGLVFDVTTAFTLNSVDVFNGTTSSGTFIIQLQNSAGIALQTSSTFTAPAGTGVIGTTVAYTANLGWNIPIGTGYRLLVTSGTASLIREGSLGGFPYSIGTVGSITSGYISGTSTTYYYLYNWKVTSGVDQSNLYSWSWNSTPAIATNIGTTSETNTGATATTKTYTVTATNATTGCVNTATTSAVTINPVTAAPTATNSTQCGVGIPSGSIASNSGLSSPIINWYSAASGGTLVLSSYTGPLSTYYTNDFSANTGIGVLTGSASLSGGNVQLTPNSASQLGALTIPASGINADKHTISFNLLTSNIAQSGADGLSYSFGDDISGTTTTINAEQGSGTKLKVSFDAYGTTGNDISGIRIIYGTTTTTPGQVVGTNGVLFYSNNVSWAAVSGNVPVSIAINNLSQLTLTVNGVVIVSNLQLPAAYINADKSTWQHGFKARTGGIFMVHGIDNLIIQQSSYLAATSYPNAVSSTVTYYATESNSSGCNSTATPITFTVNNPPSITATASVNPVCSGSATVLSVTSANSGYTYSWNNSAGTGASVTVNPTSAITYTVTATDNSGGSNNGCSTSASIAITTNSLPSAVTLSPATSTSLCMGDVKTIVASGGNISSSANATLGNGLLSNGTTTFPNPLLAWYGGAKHQMLISAAELSAQGLIAGSSISSVKFDISAFTAAACTDFTIRMGNTANTALTSFVAGTSSVYGPTTFTPSATGLVTFTFTTPFTWNGTSNVILETVHNAGNGGNGATTTVKYTTTSTNTVYYGAKDNVTGGISGFDALTTWTNTGASSSRPNIVFGYSSTIPATFSWNNSSSLFTNSTATTAYTGNPTTVYAKPTATTTYTATATNAAGCTTSASVAVNVATPSTQTLANNDYVWRGTTNTDWSTAANWVKYDGTTYAVASTSPVANDNVFIPQNNTCVVNQPSIGTATVTVNTIYIEPNATVTGGSGSLDVKGNFTNNGTFTAGTGTVSFSGTTAQQITGATTFYNLTENNSAGLTLNNPVSVTNNLTMTAGVITTATNLLTLGNSAPATLAWTSGKVVGPMKRWMAATTNSGASSSLFPLGNATRKAQASIEYTTAPTTAGYLEAKFIATSPANAATNAYATLTDQFNYVLDNVVTEGYWEIKPSATTGVAGGVYTVNLEGDNISLAASTNASYTDVRVIKSPDPHTSWILQGDHGAATGTNADFTVSRTGMSGYSFFAMAFPSSAPLPIELVSFAANCADNNTVAVNWTTASEHNSDYYTVEKSRDGISWNVLKTIPAAGNSTQLINYSFADAIEVSGTVYYRLTQVDIDGASKMYDIVSTNCSSESELSLIAYPNPSNGQFTVKIENALGGKYALAITDMQGKAIEVQTIDLETGTTVVKLNPVGLQPGVYLLQFMQDGNLLQQQKLIIE